MSSATAPTAEPSPASLAEKELQKAVLAYSAEQTSANRQTLWTAVNRLQELLPWPQGTTGVSPAHKRMLELLPERLRWPDPIWGDSLFD